MRAVCQRRECGEHWGSFTPFEFDITDTVVDGANTLAVYIHDEWAGIEDDKALHPMGLSRFPSADKAHPYAFPARGGLWGGVALEWRAEVFVHDVFVKTSTRRREMEIVCEVVNASGAPRSVRLDFALAEWPDGAGVDLGIPSRTLDLAAGALETTSICVPWDSPRLWSPERPNLYVLNTTIVSDQGIDALSTRFGFREFRVEGKLFLLNGIPIRLRGESTYRFKRERELNVETFLLYKRALGVNAVRSSAWIGPAAVYQGADEAGILVIAQSSVWSAMGAGYRAGGERFLANARREFAEWIRRDRNCPSIVIWDVENEMLRDAHYDLNRAWVTPLDGFARENDDTRPIEHSGAGWYDPNQEIIHIHMHEHYSRVMAEWKERGERPLVLGEFWVGGRGEERLPSSKEVRSSAEFFEEEARMYEMAMLEMRHYGVWGIMPLTLRITAFTSPEFVGHWSARDFGNAHEIQPGQEGIPAIAKQLVPGVGGGAGAPNEHLYARFTARLDHRLGHDRVKLAETGNVGAPAADGYAFPRFVPQLDRVDRALGPAVLADHVLQVTLELGVERRQPGEIFLDPFDAGVVRFQPGTAPPEGLPLAGGVAAAHREHQGQVVGHGPIDVRVGDGFIAALGAGALNPQALEHVKNLRRHLMRPAQVHRVGRQPFAARLRRRHPHAGAAKGAAPIPQLEHHRITAKRVADLRTDGETATLGR